MAGGGKAQHGQLARRGLLDEVVPLGREATEGPGLVVPPLGGSRPVRNVQHDPELGGIGEVDRAVVGVRAVQDHGSGRSRRVGRVLVEVGVIAQVEGVLLDRYLPSESAGDEAGGSVGRRHVRQVDERLDLVVAGLGPRHGDGVVGKVDVEELVVAGGLSRVLGCGGSHVHPDVVATAELLGQVDQQVAHGDGVERAAVEGKPRPIGVPGPPARIVTIRGRFGHLLGGREKLAHRPLGRRQQVSRQGTLDHTPTVLLPVVPLLLGEHQ